MNNIHKTDEALGFMPLPDDSGKPITVIGTDANGCSATNSTSVITGISGHAGISGSSFETPHMQSRGHYNSTVMPGDRFSLRGWMLFAVVASGAVYLF